MEAELIALMHETVKAYPPVSTDAYGRTGYGTAVMIKAHVLHRHVEMTNHKGETVVSKGRAFLGGVYPSLSPDWLVEIPDLSAPGGYRKCNIIAVETRNDENGPHHQVLYFGEHGGWTGRNM